MNVTVEIMATTPRIPGIAECYALFDRYHMLPNIREHSLMVARVAATLVDSITMTTGHQNSSTPLRDLVLAGALLHDIAKTECITTGGRHAERGRQICSELGCPEIGDIVAEHVILREYTPELYRQGRFGAKELVFYADKRVLHDELVPLDTRRDYILTRYGGNDRVKRQKIEHYFVHAIELEEYLFTYIGYQPDELGKYLVRIPLPG